MSIAYAYFLTPICVAVLFAAVGLFGNRPRSKPGIYGYPEKTIRLVLFGLPILVGLGAAMLLVSPKASWKHPVADATFGCCALGVYLLGYFHVRSFFVQLQSSVLTWGSMFYRKTLPLSSIKRYAFIEGGRGGQTIELRNARNRVAFRIADSVQDFGALAADIRKELRHEGVAFARRDIWGDWSEEKR